ncbi:hypothetical protein [Xenorhabdus bovienii]|uniref:Uncharacterized protein n=1 Tax=Xenorhabdus bovienii str. kraussei Becker Underwood TaxID=1398204 RepID=A0A077PRJ0_XENBV|nr:hypothetical protein [Xenorhabdus bovienii]CDH23376.1 hypothetical protein XBKB1_1730028 [Xenorhabdus bovienii str. kraussei Becker Underwood]
MLLKLSQRNPYPALAFLLLPLSYLCNGSIKPRSAAFCNTSLALP